MRKYAELEEKTISELVKEYDNVNVIDEDLELSTLSRNDDADFLGMYDPEAFVVIGEVIINDTKNIYVQLVCGGIDTKVTVNGEEI